MVIPSFRRHYTMLVKNAIGRTDTQLVTGLPTDNGAYVMTSRSRGLDSRSGMCVQHVRLFRNLPEIRWEYRVHEQIIPSLRRAGHEIRWTDIVIEHTGYQDPAVRARKLERNLRLLHLDQADRPDDAFTLFNLGLSYLELNRPGEAVPFLQASLKRLDPQTSITPRVYAALTRAYERLRQPGLALAACADGRIKCPGDPELMLLDGFVRRAVGDNEGAKGSWRSLLAQKNPVVCAPVNPGPAAPEAAAPAVPLGQGVGGPQGAGQVGRFVDADEGLWNQARHQLAVICREEGNFPEAEQHWREVLAEEPDSAAAWQGLGELYLAQGRWPELDQAAAQLEAAPGSAPDQAGALPAAVLRARGRLARREFGPARLLLEETIARAPQAVPPRVFLTHVLLQEGSDPAAAERALRELVALDPGQAEAWRNLAVLLRSQSRLAEAVAACQSGRAHREHEPELALLHGLLPQEMGDLVNSERVLRELVERETSLPAGPAGPGEVARQRRVTARHSLALIYRQQNRLADAEAQWRSALAEAPEMWAGWQGLGELCLVQGRLGEVEGILGRLESGPRPNGPAGTPIQPVPAARAAAVLLRARLFLEQKQFPAARAVLEQAIAQEQRAIPPRRLLSYALLQENRDLAAAERALRDLIGLDPTDAEAQHNLAILIRSKGGFEPGKPSQPNP
jgi:tetratricopeptide (TPR) repeat protein